MIEYIAGALVDKRPTEVVVDVAGIGYKILIPTSTFEQLPEREAPVKLLCHHHVREDAEQLYGFLTTAERSTFDLLISVSGIGPKLALAALSALSPSEIRLRVLEGDAAMLTRIPGVGRKTAERLIVDLRDKFEKLELAGDPDGSGNGMSPREDALAALEALGLSRSAADKTLREVLRLHPDATSVEEMIRLALRQ